MSFLTDIFVRDKYTGNIHKVGDDPHDSLYVDDEGTLHYSNLQNGDGCVAYKSKNKETISNKYPNKEWGERADEFLYGFEFVTCTKDCEYCQEDCPFKKEADND